MLDTNPSFRRKTVLIEQGAIKWPVDRQRREDRTILRMRDREWSSFEALWEDMLTHDCAVVAKWLHRSLIRQGAIIVNEPNPYLFYDGMNIPLNMSSISCPRYFSICIEQHAIAYDPEVKEYFGKRTHVAVPTRQHALELAFQPAPPRL